MQRSSVIEYLQLYVCDRKLPIHHFDADNATVHRRVRWKASEQYLHRMDCYCFIIISQLYKRRNAHIHLGYDHLEQVRNSQTSFMHCFQSCRL